MISQTSLSNVSEEDDAVVLDVVDVKVAVSTFDGVPVVACFSFKMTSQILSNDDESVETGSCTADRLILVVEVGERDTLAE